MPSGFKSRIWLAEVLAGTTVSSQPWSISRRKNVVLDPEIEGDDLERTSLVLFTDSHFPRAALLRLGRVDSEATPTSSLLAGDFLDQILSQPLPVAWRVLRTRERGIEVACRDHAAHGAVSANVAHQSPRVDFRNANDVVLTQIVGNEALLAPVAGNLRHLAHHETFGKRTSRLGIVGIDSVVSNEGIGEN